MPLPESTIAELHRIFGPENVLTAREDLIPYSFDRTAALQQLPGVVVIATETKQISSLLQHANQAHCTVVTRGSGTGLSGGSLPNENCIVLCLSKMHRILEVDAANLTLLAEAGATTQAVAEAAARQHGVGPRHRDRQHRLHRDDSGDDGGRDGRQG